MRPYIDSIIIHGNPNPKIARERADRAYKQVWHQNGRMATDPEKEMLLIATGGQGSAELILNQLKDLGVPYNQLRTESDQSRDTLDNIRNGLPLCKGKKIGFVSNRFHLNRSKYLFEGLKREGTIDYRLDFIPLPTKTTLRDFTYETAAFPLTCLATLDGFTEASINENDRDGIFTRLFYHKHLEKKK